MKTEIKKIIDKYPVNKFHSNKGCEDVAKEIESHVFEFVEWLKDNTDTIMDWETEKKVWTNFHPERLIEQTTEQIYDYWITNVHNKSEK